jgi:hypothetical protein
MHARSLNSVEFAQQYSDKSNHLEHVQLKFKIIIHLFLSYQ